MTNTLCKACGQVYADPRETCECGSNNMEIVTTAEPPESAGVKALAAARGSVPYHELPLLEPAKIKWVNGESIAFKDGRKVSAYRGEIGDGIFFLITSPLEDGRESVLKFRLSDEAAAALAMLISNKLTAPNAPRERRREDEHES